MYRTIYIATSAAAVKDIQLEFINRNIANANTYGYKKERTAFSSFLPPSGSLFNTSARVFVNPDIIVGTDYTEGELLNTSNPLDLALRGKGFFALEGNRYTRRGDFRLDSEGYLVNQRGIRVLDSNSKPIRIPGGKVTVSRDGTIMVDNIRVGRLKVVDFPTPYNLIKVGDSLYMPAGQQRPEDTDAVVIQGALEGSNVNIVKEMALMIDTIREFESFQRTIKSIDDMSSKAINEIGRI